MSSIDINDICRRHSQSIELQLDGKLPGEGLVLDLLDDVAELLEEVDRLNDCLRGNEKAWANLVAERDALRKERDRLRGGIRAVASIAQTLEGNVDDEVWAVVREWIDALEAV